METDSGQIDFPAQEHKIGEHQHERERAADPEDRAGLIHEDIENGMEGNHKAQQGKGAHRPQPYPLPEKEQAHRHHHTAHNVHGSGAKAPNQQTQEVGGAVGREKADVLERGETH